MVLDKYSANFLFTLWKRVREYGACCTGLTQNVDDLLQSHTAQTMLANKVDPQGLDDGTERLRGQLRDVAQHGQRDDFGGDQLGDAKVSGVKRAEQLAERLLGKRKKGAAHNPDTGPNGHSGRHDPQGAAKPRDDGILPPRDRLHGREARDPLQAQSAVRGHPQPQSALQKPQKRSIKTKDAYLKIQADPAPATPPSALQQGKASFV